MLKRVKHSRQRNTLTRVISKGDVGVQHVQSYSEIPEATKQDKKLGKYLHYNVLILLFIGEYSRQGRKYLSCFFVVHSLTPSLFEFLFHVISFNNKDSFEGRL